jgi:HlyD family secretion protein
VVVSRVVEAPFEDFIPLRGIATPTTTVFLDAVEGGRIETKLVEDGALVTAGQPLVVLSNSQLQFDVIRSESEVTNQLNNLRTLEIQLARNRIESERTVNDIRWQLKRLARKAERDSRLAGGGFESKATVQDGLDEDEYLRTRLEITLRGQQADEQLQTTQLAQLRSATRQLEANLKLVRTNLDALTVRAPIAGRLTAFDVQLGQSLARGQRLGQVDSPDAARLLVNIDEFYLSRVAPGQLANLDQEGRSYAMTIRKLNPQVRNGRFEGELVFATDERPALKRGQTLTAKLSLGESRPALLLPAGAFLIETAGAFVFVVDGKVATRRTVQLGRRNSSFVEVLEGLAAGERVITSSYAGLTDKDRLTLTP